MRPVSIAIDGPSGAGKSTIARAVARRLGFTYVDTGAIYRTVGLYVKRRGLPPADREGTVACLPELNIELRHIEGVQHVFLNGEDVSQAIRMPEISLYASHVSAVPEVRAFLLELQREFARREDVVMDGRDIGTVVLPDARVKIFLTASVKERAHRRFEELKEKGVDTSYEEVLRDMEFRDRNDSSRAAAPLRQAEDAVLVDTTGNTLEQSISQLEKTIKERL